VRRLPASLAVLAGALVLAGASASLRAGRKASDKEVPQATVTKGAFVRRVSAEGNLRASKATPLVAPGSGLTLKIAWMADDGTPVKKGDVVVRFDPTATEKLLETGKNEREQSEAKKGKTSADSGAAVANLGRDARQAHLERTTAETFQSKDPELFSRREIREAELDVSLAGAREQKALGVKTSKERLAGTELSLVGIDRRKADLKIKRAEDELKALSIEALHDGLLVFQRDWRGELPAIGQQVWSGFKVAEIPDLASIMADVFLLEADAGGIAPGHPATVVVESDPDHPLDAVVERVDSVPKTRVRGSPVQYFGATLKLKAPSSAAGRLKPGQRVIATLRLDERQGALLVPRPALQVRDGKKVVFVKRKGSFVPVEVTPGPTGIGLAVIDKGLQEGEVVALVDPEKGPSSPGAPTPKAAAAPGPPGGRG